MRGGHNVKSAADLKRSGTFRKDRHGNRVESAAKPMQYLPEAPPHFDKRHVSAWNTVCGNVKALGILTEQDLSLMEVYVVFVLIWQDAAAEVQKRGITFTDGDRVIKNPAFVIMTEAAKMTNQIGAQFGFSPKSRMSIKTEPQEPEDPFAQFFQ